MTGASKRDRGPLGGLVRLQLIRELALSDMTQTQLAGKYGVRQSSISEFAKRNAEQIQHARTHSADEFAGILIAEKARRLAAYEEIHNKAMEPTPKITNKGTVVVDPESGEFVYEVNASAAMTALKSVAEELGHLPGRVTVSGEMNNTTTYRIVNVTDEDLT